MGRRFILISRKLPCTALSTSAIHPIVMPKRKQSPAVSSAPAVSVPANLQSSKRSLAFRFPVLVAVSLSLSSLLYSFASGFTAGDLSSVSRSPSDWWEIAGLLGWKTAELGVGWWGDYDGLDVTALTILSHAPHLFLLFKFYGIRPTTVMTCLFIDTLTTFTPISLFRHISAVHRFTSPKGTVKNRSVINDLTVRVGGAVLASAVYGLVVLICYRSWLAVHLVIYFEGIRDISATHSADHISLVALFLPLGWAAREFIFTPAVGAKPDAHDKKTAAFNPETATLSETMEWNFWGFSKKTRVLVERTATAAAIGGLHTWVQAYFTIEGVEAYGAAGWAIIWVFAAIATGTAFSWVANYDGV